VDRYCGNCGNALAEDDLFCPKCGKPVHGTARVATPEADVPTRPPPSAAGPVLPPPPQQQGQGVGVWSGVKIGCGMFIVLPILIVIGFIVLLAIIGSL
jgi:uncharacterized membrane protein YvbJ